LQKNEEANSNEDCGEADSLPYGYQASRNRTIFGSGDITIKISVSNIVNAAACSAHNYGA
jgi:hypothetical protein